MTASEILPQMQADVLDVPVVRPEVVETTCLGAAYAAGLAVGFWPDLAALRANWRADADVAAGAARGRPRRRLRPLAQGRRPHPRLGLTVRQQRPRTPNPAPGSLVDRDTRGGRRSPPGHQCGYGCSPTVTVTVCSEPSRCTVSSSSAPTVLPWMAPIRSSEPLIGRSPTLVTTSPASSPALSAGPPASNALDPRAAGVRVGDLDAEVRVADLLALDELVGDGLRLVGRDREADADVAVGALRGDRAVDADDLAVHVDQRATGVARVDRGVGLDRVADRDRVAGVELGPLVARRR